jgi:hypothetical protein
MATREEMIAASKKRFGKAWKPIDWHDTGDPEFAPKETYKYWDTSCWNPESGCSVHSREIDNLTAQYDKLMGTNAAGGGVLANDGSNQEWMRESVDKAEVTRAYANARTAATEKWAASAAPDQQRTVSLCREINAGWDEKVRELEARAAEIDGGMKSGRFRTKKGGGSCGGVKRVGGMPIATSPSAIMMAAAAAIGFLVFMGAINGKGGNGNGGSANYYGDMR